MTHRVKLEAVDWHAARHTQHQGNGKGSPPDVRRKHGLTSTLKPGFWTLELEDSNFLSFRNATYFCGT